MRQTATRREMQCHYAIQAKQMQGHVVTMVVQRLGIAILGILNVIADCVRMMLIL